MSRHFKVHELLSRSELDELEAFAREPGRTVDGVSDWLLAHGFRVSRGAVWAWKKQFDAEDHFRASSEVARSLLATANKDTVALGDAATVQLTQLLFEQLLRLQQDGEVETKELWAASMGLKNAIQSGRHLEKLRQETSERQKKAVEEAEKVAKSGGGSEAVIGKVREILGIS